MNELDLVVVDLADRGGVRTLTLTGRGSGLLPAYVPGSHVVVDCGGRANAYSLLGDGVAPAAYRISVLRLPDGSGGSCWLHDELRVGDQLAVSLPRSAFAPVANAGHHLLVAAGIGITPLLSHARAALRWGRSFTLLYRHDGAGAHLDELQALCGDRLQSLTNRPDFWSRLNSELSSQPLGTHLYLCGPGALIDQVMATATALGWPATRLHSERFSADVLDPGTPFMVRVGSAMHEVPAGESLLDVLEANGHRLASRCRQGVCGECLLQVKSGQPEHRDLYLSADERAMNDCLLPCVSRSVDDVLEVAW